MTAAGAARGAWKYRLGLLLILAVVLIWVGSAEITQLIFEKYRHPFLLTWLGASLLAFYLPFAYLRECLTPMFNKCSSQDQQSHKLQKFREKAHNSSDSLLQMNAVPIPGHSPISNGVIVSPKELEMVPTAKSGPSKMPAGGSSRSRSPRPPRSDGEDEEEGAPLLPSSQETPPKHAPGVPGEIMPLREVAAIALILAPIWLLTEYLSNAALSMTSVASTTILSSTSGLFTLLCGVTFGGEKMTTGKIMAALISIAGVVMTELGKSSAADDDQVFGDADRNPGETAGDLGLTGHNLAGDVCGLLSAVSYGVYTTLLRKYVGGEGEDGEEKADLQKVFGFIGLFTLLGLWWLVFPLHLIGWEPVPTMPSTYGLDEDILANGLVGSMISDYFWAVSVVWTTPLVATLGLSLTIPLAMVADMVMHQRVYSLTYVLGALGVFMGFLVANAGENVKVLPEGMSQRLSSCLPSWLRKGVPNPPTPGIDVTGDVVFSDKEYD